MKMMQAEFTVMEREEILEYWDRMRGSRIVKIHGLRNLSETVGGVLTGAHVALKGLLDGQVKAVVIVKGVGKTCVILQVWSPGAARKLKDAFFSFLKGSGFEEVTGASPRSDDPIMKLFSMERVYTLFKRRL